MGIGLSGWKCWGMSLGITDSSWDGMGWESWGVSFRVGISGWGFGVGVFGQGSFGLLVGWSPSHGKSLGV